MNEESNLFIKAMAFKIKPCFLLIFLLFFSTNSYAQIYKNVPAAIHVQSDVSDGEYPFDKIVKIAKEKNIKVIIFTDSALRRWEYGIPPLEHIIKRRIEHASVFSFGIKNYLNAIENIQKVNPDMVVVFGVEAIPFYYWEGNFLERNLTLHNWHKQLLIMGLEKESDYRYLPIISNYSILALHRGNLRRLWPLMFIILGILAIKFSFKKRGSLRQLGYIILIVFGVILFNNLHFDISHFDAYHKDQGAKPYQELINYVNNKGGLVFWIYPEVESSDIYTPSFRNDLFYTHDYAGSAMLFDDNRSVAKAGDIWDTVLLDYCSGRRKPVWTIGAIDYQGGRQDISRIQTILLLLDLNRNEVLKALKNGRMYAKLNNQPNDFSLDKFIISDSKKETFGFMGEDIEIDTKPEIIIETTCSNSPQEPIEISLIRNGQLIKTFNYEGSNFIVIYEDDYFEPNKKIFYRIMIKSNRNIYRIISNPIFVKFISK